ncbi:RNA-directed DNA polymerase from mobile element jockey [Trichonephila clavipes]|nr:RNA-directed DNA polymerase from mobile element jockey [Trichonephila clavipes]
MMLSPWMVKSSYCRTLPLMKLLKIHVFFVLSLPNNEMSRKSPFAIFKALQTIGEPKSVKKMKSGDLRVETNSAVQSKSYLSAKTFLDSPLLVTPHKSLNSS